MPLIIDCKECDGHDPELMYPMATYMMVLGVNPLKSDEDVDKLFARYLTYKIIHDEMDEHLTLAEFRAYKGAWANTSTYTDREFDNRVKEWMNNRVQEIIKTERKAL